MNQKRRIASFAVAFLTIVLPCVVQGQENSQAQPAVTGSGKANHIAVWTSGTNLASSGIIATGGNVGIGTSAPAAKLEVNGNAQVDGNFSLSGSILETGVGQLLWAPNDGSANFSVGLSALAAGTTGTSNTALGDAALGSNSSGYYNTAIGYSALYENTTGYANTATGDYALRNNTTGMDNAAFGYGVLGYNNSFGNTGIGYSALSFNTTGSNNLAAGVSAMYSNISGSDNTASGGGALISNTTGSYNVAAGEGALFLNSVGSNNIALGYLAGYNVISTSNNIEIGNGGVVTDSATIRIGCTNSSNCSTAAGVTSLPQTSTFIAGIYGATTSLNSTMPVIIDANGNLGTVQSSRRYKEDINDMADASDGLMQLRPVTFRYKKAYEDGSKPVQYGLIAEEVEQVYPDLVARSADGQVESVRYQLLDPMLLNELQKQHATIAAQKEQIRSLEERLARIEAMLTAGATGAAGR